MDDFNVHSVTGKVLFNAINVMDKVGQCAQGAMAPVRIQST